LGELTKNDTSTVQQRSIIDQLLPLYLHDVEMSKVLVLLIKGAVLEALYLRDSKSTILVSSIAEFMSVDGTILMTVL
jgi:hypothetical protein